MVHLQCASLFYANLLIPHTFDADSKAVAQTDKTGSPYKAAKNPFSTCLHPPKGRK